MHAMQDAPVAAPAVAPAPSHDFEFHVGPDVHEFAALKAENIRLKAMLDALEAGIRKSWAQKRAKDCAAIKNYLFTYPQRTPAQIAAACDMKLSRANTLLRQMRAQGEVRWMGVWIDATPGDEAPESSESSGEAALDERELAPPNGYSE